MLRIMMNVVPVPAMPTREWEDGPASVREAHDREQAETRDGRLRKLLRTPSNPEGVFLDELLELTIGELRELQRGSVDPSWGTREQIINNLIAALALEEFRINHYEVRTLS